MLELSKDIKNQLREGKITKKELVDHLVRNHSVFDIADELAVYLIESAQCEANMIILTPKQHQLLLKVMGKITRELHTDLGRKPKSEKRLKQREVNTDQSV